MDLDLLSAFIERWRRKTCTFHIQTGEMMLILYDIVVLFNLSINGWALITVSIWNKITLCKQAFEQAPLLLKCLRRTLYVWDDFITISLNHLFMLTTRFYDGMLMLTNNAINILNDLVWILSHCCINNAINILYMFINILFMDFNGICVPFVLPTTVWGLRLYFTV